MNVDEVSIIGGVLTCVNETDWLMDEDVDLLDLSNLYLCSLIKLDCLSIDIDEDEDEDENEDEDEVS